VQAKVLENSEHQKTFKCPMQTVMTHFRLSWRGICSWDYSGLGRYAVQEITRVNGELQSCRLQVSAKLYVPMKLCVFIPQKTNPFLVR